MHPTELERRGPVARGDERVHQTPRRVRPERFGRPGRQPRALLFHPALEFSGSAHIETIEEGPSIDSDGPRGISAIERLLEVLEVSADDLGIQSQLGRTE